MENKYMTPKIVQAEYAGEYRIKLKFEDGAEGIVDLNSELYGEVFEPLKSIDYFKTFRIQGSSLSWDNGADFAPEFLYDCVKSAEMVKG